jgi:hypothetical protein
MFSYIVPTVNRYPGFAAQIEKIAAHPLIGEVIVINNSGKNPPASELTTNNYQLITPEQPLFCNGAWNIGAANANEEYLILATEDITYNVSIFTKIHNFFRSPIHNPPCAIGIVGCNPSLLIDQADKSETQFYTLPNHRPYCFGLMMFLQKENFIPIPEGLKHWFGDDFLFKVMKRRDMVNFTFQGSFHIETKIGSCSQDPITQTRIQHDTYYWSEYQKEIWAAVDQTTNP